jgi:hypothetical protein
LSAVEETASDGAVVAVDIEANRGSLRRLSGLINVTRRSLIFVISFLAATSKEDEHVFFDLGDLDGCSADAGHPEAVELHISGGLRSPSLREITPAGNGAVRRG